MIILSLSRLHISAFKVEGLITKRYELIAEGDFAHPEDLPAVLEQLTDDLAGQTIRVLFSDDLVYLFETDLSESGKSPREELHEYLEATIPDRLDEDSWDFLLYEGDAQRRSAIVFAPVSSYWRPLKTYADAHNLSIEAFDSTKIAEARHNDPLIGLAQKNATKTDDTHSLNITRNITPSKMGWKRPILLLGTVAIIIIVSTGGWYAYHRYTTPSVQSPPPPEPVKPVEAPATPIEATPAASPTPVIAPPSAEVLETITIQVLNGTGIPGTAAEYGVKLREKGFRELALGNADSYTYSKTQLRAKSRISPSIRTFISDMFLPGSIEEGEALPDDSLFDIQLIIGSRK